jgi:hypothetical protein
MNEQQRWEYIEKLFEQMIALCDEMMKKIEEPPGKIEEWTWVVPRQNPISPDEAKRLLEDAKEFLMEGE